MDESHYLELVADAYRKIEDALEEVDPGDVDVNPGGDVLTLTLADGVRCVVNTQRATRQIWVAARATAWHFSYQETGETAGRWIDDHGKGELFENLATIIRQGSKIEVKF